jgi:hypothetical protein
MLLTIYTPMHVHAPLHTGACICVITCASHTFMHLVGDSFSHMQEIRSSSLSTTRQQP